MKKLIKELEGKLKEYTKLVERAERRSQLNFEETEDYGVYLGKKELLEDIIFKLKNLK